MLWWSGWRDHSCWSEQTSRRASKKKNEHIPLFYKTCHSILIAVIVCQRVLKPLNVNQCQPINSFTLTGSHNCKQNVLNINVLFFRCCAFSSVFSCIYNRGMRTPPFIFIFSIPVNTKYVEAARSWMLIIMCRCQITL